MIKLEFNEWKEKYCGCPNLDPNLGEDLKKYHNLDINIEIDAALHSEY